jgi:methionyl-tRNA formyltransferase
MHIVLLCATQRGHRLLKRLIELVPDCQLTVFSFPEDAWEPRYLDDIRATTQAFAGQFVEARQVSAEKWRAFWQATPIDLMLAVSWRYLIPADIYRLPKLGTFVFHDSLLPAYRGFSPTVWAIINGEDHTGVTLFEMADEVDSGDVVMQTRVQIGADETIADILERVTATYVGTLETALPLLLEGRAPRLIQDQTQASFTCKRLPEDNHIDWTRPANEIYNLIRAVTAPYPGAFTTFGGKKLTIWSASRLPDYRRYVGAIPGRVVAVQPGEGTVVLTGDGVLLLRDVQLEDEPARCASEVLTSISHTVGR